MSSLSREEIASHILEHLNAEAKAYYHGEDAYTEHNGNYLNRIEETYNKNRDVTDKFSGAWRWLIDQEYLTDTHNAVGHPGWCWLTAKGRAIKMHDRLQVPRVPRNMNPGPAPDFRPDNKRPTSQAHACALGGGGDGLQWHAHLSTVIMLGSLLEGALLAKCLENDVAAKEATRAPKDHGRVKDYDKWSLSNFIEVADDSQWIHKQRNDFADTLRDYRNMVHPYNACTRGYFVDKGTAKICWEVVKASVGDLEVKV